MPSELVEVGFKGNRTGVYSNPVDLNLKPGDYVIVEVERGEDIGTVLSMGRVVSLKEQQGRTELTLHHGLFDTAELCKIHDEGWIECFDALDGLMEKEAAA